jgi:hypothetical protein
LAVGQPRLSGSANRPITRVLEARGAVVALCLALLVVGACSIGPSAKHGDVGEPGKEPGTGATNQGGETKPTAYTDARYHYTITGPGPLTPQPDGTAAFSGEDEKLEVAVVTGSKAADPLALAKSDLNSLKGSPDFQVLVQPTSISVNGQRAAKFTYSYTAQSHLGKQAKFFAVRYYVPKNDTMLAVVSYRDIATEFDAVEADGFADSLRWL